jgi:hypothetical protein
MESTPEMTVSVFKKVTVSVFEKPFVNVRTGSTNGLPIVEVGVLVRDAGEPTPLLSVTVTVMVLPKSDVCNTYVELVAPEIVALLSNHW